MTDKEIKKVRTNLKIRHNLLVSKFNFKEIQTWHDIYKYQGFTEDYISKTFKPELLTTKPTYPELKLYLEKEKQECESSFNELPREERAQNESTEHKNPLEEIYRGLNSIPFVQLTDLPPNDSNYCTVLALKTLLNIPYDKASSILDAEGRAERGIRSNWLSEFLLDIGFVVVDHSIKLEEVVKKYPKGKYWLNSKEHAFSMIDGVVYDYTLPDKNTKLERVYRYEPLKKDLEKNEDKANIVVAALNAVESARDNTTDEPIPAKSQEPEGMHDARDNYGYVRSPHVSKELFEYWFQKKAAAELIDKITVKKYRGVLLLSGTGTGKTFIIGMVNRHLEDIKWYEGKTWSHIPLLTITKRTVVEQTKRVYKKLFNIDPDSETEVINIEQLRSGAGQLWVKEKVKVEGGVDKTYWEWKKGIHPCVVSFDESQGAKNRGSKQSQIIYAYNNIPDNTCLISISATPFTRVSEAQAFAVSTHRSLEHLGFPKGTILTNDNWPAYASIISQPSKPEDYNQAAVERLMKDLEEYVVRVRGVRPQFEAQNGVKIIQFSSQEERDFYHSAIERFEAEKAKLDLAKDAGLDVGTCYLVILLKFAMAAEYCHAEHFARDMYECWKKGKAPVAAVKFKQTLIQIVRLLNEKYGISRDNISLIWGGGQTQLTAKQKTRAKVKEKAERLRELGIEVDEMMEDLGLEDVEDRVIVDLPEHLRLGMQSPEERQKEIDKFQSGKSQFCLYTLKAGGVGLSLHHCDELTSFKCRRKESGYAVEEDIPKVPVRPRETFMVVTYNAIELVQASGRVPRLTSLSSTVQNVYCYAGTVEVDMGRIYTAKFRCLSAVVKMHESWQDLMFNANRQKAVEEAVNTTKNVANDESSLIDEGDIEEDEDNNGNGKE